MRIPHIIMTLELIEIKDLEIILFINFFSSIVMAYLINTLGMIPFPFSLHKTIPVVFIVYSIS